METNKECEMNMKLDDELSVAYIICEKPYPKVHFDWNEDSSQYWIDYNNAYDGCAFE